MLREAKDLVDNKKIGKIKLINVEYPQGYTVAVKKKDQKNILKWRLDKNMCGPSMILAEIGTHAYHLLRYVTALEVNEISAEVSSLSDEISVDDNAFITLRMNNKARGSIWVSSAATGGENGLKIRIYGTKGAVEWFQDDPNILKFTEVCLCSLGGRAWYSQGRVCGVKFRWIVETVVEQSANRRRDARSQSQIVPVCV